MSKGLYPKLAWTGIRKNGQLYFPYLISGAAMIMMFYIVTFLADSGLVHSLRGGMAMTSLLFCGECLVGLFSAPFLFYTSSSLLKKRKKELGLYNILGMNKGNILKILFWETLITYGIALGLGLLLGIALSKAAELGLVNIMEEETDYRIYIEWKAVFITVLLYGAVYFLIFLNMIRQVRQNNPVELLRSATAGERPPKSRWVMAAAGAILTGTAYGLALKVENPATGLQQCVAILALVVAGTYLLFVAGSVFLCRTLQRNKRYYYKPAHFVTVSSLTYRMKRNGASLASICILATVILVILAGTMGFYSGVDNIIERRYAYDMSISVKAPQGTGSGREGYGAAYRTKMEEVLEGVDARVSETAEVYSAGLSAPVSEGKLDLGVDIYENAPEEGNIAAWNVYLENFLTVRVLSLKDYNRLCGTWEELGEGETLIAGEKQSFAVTTVRGWDGREYSVKKTIKQIPRLSGFRLFGSYQDTMLDTLLLVVPDMERFFEGFDAQDWISKNEVVFFWEYDIDLEEDKDRQLAISEAVRNTDWGNLETEEGFFYAKQEKWADLKGLAGGGLFLAILMSAVFVFAATLIMYYKQISEGYEDQRQFSIMRKIGMTKKEIRRSINSQMLTVFCFPLFLAGLHLVFAVPAVHQLLKATVLDDRPLLIKVTAGCFLLFALVYAFVYMLTTRTYSRIVNMPAD